MEGPYQARLCKAEYVKRHNEIWPEMVEVLKAAGICNYTIFANGEELFGYYECEKGIAFAEKTQADSPVVDRWNEYMKDIYYWHIKYLQDPATGLWRTILDDPESYEEVSASCGIAAAMIVKGNPLHIKYINRAIPGVLTYGQAEGANSL